MANRAADAAPLPAATGDRSRGGVRAGAELLDADHGTQRALQVPTRERFAQDVVGQGVGDRGHDHALVEREVRARHDAAVDVDAVAEPHFVYRPGKSWASLSMSASAAPGA